MTEKLESSVDSSHDDDLAIDVSDILEEDDIISEIDFSGNRIPDEKGAIDISRMEDIKIAGDNKIIRKPYSAEGFYLKGFYMLKNEEYKDAKKQFKMASERSKSGRIAKRSRRQIEECNKYIN